MATHKNIAGWTENVWLQARTNGNTNDKELLKGQTSECPPPPPRLLQTDEKLETTQETRLPVKLPVCMLYFGGYMVL
jgi:hypothetical protein